MSQIKVQPQIQIPKLTLFYIDSRKKNHPKIQVFFLTLLIAHTVNSLSVTSVVLSDPGASGNPSVLEGSLMGGTYLKIQGTGFSSTKTDNNIMLDDFPCIVQDGGTSSQLICETSSSDSETEDIMNLPVSVSVLGSGTITAQETFSYTYAETPIINFVYPSVSYSGSGTTLYFMGMHRIQDLGNGISSGMKLYYFR